MAYQGKRRGGGKQYDNTNRVAVFKNTKRREDKNDAHYTGTLNVDGKEYFINLWKNEPSEKGPVLSGSIKPKEKNDAQFEAKEAPPAKPSKSKGDDFDDDLPF